MNKHILLLGTAIIALPGLCETAHAQASASPYTSATRYDLMGRVTGTISPNSPAYGYSTFLATRTTYDGVGRPIKIEIGRLDTWQSESVAPANWGSAFFAFKTIETTYNAQNQKLTERVKGQDLVTYSLTQYSYGASGRLECTAVRMNTAAFGSLPASACTLGTEGSQGPDRITRNVYDAAGRLVQVREGVGAVDTNGVSIEAAEVTYGYTSNGKIEYVVDAGGHKARKCYDTFDRQTRWVFPSQTNPTSFNDSTAALALSTAGSVNGDCTATSGDYELYEYDNNGIGNSNRTKLRKRDGQELTYQYDLLNRNTVKVVPGATPSTRDVYYSYDLRGLMTSARFDSFGGEGVLFTYDGFGRKKYEDLAMDGVTRRLESQYDRDSNLIRLVYPDTNYVDYYRDGLDRPYYSSLNGVAPLVYTPFDSAGRLATVYRLNTSTANWGPNTGINYDPVSRMDYYSFGFISSSYNSTTTFAYNPANQIASQTRTNDTLAYTNHVAVNRAYVPDGLNQYDSVAGATFTHDLNGNLIADGTSTYTYDVENRMIGRSSGGYSATVRYDPLGRLYETTGTWAWSYPIRYLYDGDALVGEYNFSGGVIRRYVHGTGAGDDPQVWFEGPGLSNAERRYLYADEHGSIVAVTDSIGNVVAYPRYDEYGVGQAGGARFQYTGQIMIGELGMYYYKARMYSPTLGRFMQTDPIGYDDQFNLYAYVGNDPVNRSDPDGKDATLITNMDGSRTLLIPVNYTGSGADAGAIVSRANSISVEGTNDRIEVVATDAPINGQLNHMDVSPGLDFSTYPNGEGQKAGPGLEGTGGTEAHIDSTGGNSLGAAVHDTLHFGGMPDKYEEGDKVDGHRTSTPSPGFDDTNIMTSREGTTLKPSQFEEAAQNPTTKLCTVTKENSCR